jgi:hypothetical protein
MRLAIAAWGVFVFAPQFAQVWKDRARPNCSGRAMHPEDRCVILGLPDSPHSPHRVVLSYRDMLDVTRAIDAVALIIVLVSLRGAFCAALESLCDARQNGDGPANATRSH